MKNTQDENGEKKGNLFACKNTKQFVFEVCLCMTAVVRVTMTLTIQNVYKQVSTLRSFKKSFIVATVSTVLSSKIYNCFNFLKVLYSRIAFTMFHQFSFFLKEKEVNI